MLSLVAATIGAISAFAGWLTLGVTAGNASLQRSVAIGPLTLVEQWAALGAMLGVTGVVTAALVRIGRVRRTHVPAVLGGSVAANILAAFLLVPSLVGELEPQHGITILAVITGLGLAPFVAILATVAFAMRVGER